MSAMRTIGARRCIHCYRSAAIGFDWIPQYGWQCSDVSDYDVRDPGDMT